MPINKTRAAMKIILNIKSNLNVSVDIRVVFPNDFANSIRSVMPINEIIGIRYLNSSPQYTF